MAIHKLLPFCIVASICVTLSATSRAAEEPTTSASAGERMLRLMSEMTGKAEKQGPIRLEQFGSDDFDRAMGRSQNLVEHGRYEEAAGILQELLADDHMASDWRSMLSTRARILRQWAAGDKITLEQCREFFLKTGPRWFDKRYRPIVAVWNMPDMSDVDKYLLIAAMLEKAQDPQGQLIVLEAMATLDDAGDEQVASALVNAGNLYYRMDAPANAERLWTRVRRNYPDTISWPKAVFNLGVLYKERDAYDQAIECFEVLLGADVNDREPGGHIMEAYRNYRPRAMWQIGHCRLAQKDYEGALAAFQETRKKYPFQSWCGNGMAEYEYRYNLVEGLCQEHLGRHATAVALYFQASDGSGDLYSNPVAPLRLVALYRAAGQSEDLRRLLDVADKRKWAELRAETRRAIKREEWRQRQPSGFIRRILALHDAADARRWEVLVSQLRIRGTVAGPEEDYARRGNAEAVVAAHRLADAPGQTVPLLIERLKVSGGSDGKWVLYALGLCGTPEAVAVLKERLSQEQNSWLPQTLVYSLAQAGESGLEVLRSLPLDQQSQPMVQRALRGDLAKDPWGLPFPGIPKDLNLPHDLTELNPDRPRP